MFDRIIRSDILDILLNNCHIIHYRHTSKQIIFLPFLTYLSYFIKCHKVDATRKMLSYTRRKKRKSKTKDS